MGSGRLALTSYIDTSAILRVIEQRGDYAVAEAALRDAPFTSQIAEVESWVSIHKRWHDGDITLRQRDELVGTAQTEVFDAINLLQVDASALSQACAVGARFPLRALDALHIGSAVVLSDRIGSRHALRFCTADTRQAVAARAFFGEAQVDLLPPWR